MENAVEVITARDNAQLGSRAALEQVADEGVVSREEVDDALTETSKIVSTTEIRTEGSR